MDEIKEGDVIILNSENRIKMTVTAILINERLEATYWNPSKAEFQTITGDIRAFTKVND